MQDLDFYVSKNGRYMMLENSIFDRTNNQYADINELSFSDLINIIGENVGFMTQNLKSDLSEISSFTRKTAYNVFEYFETDTKLSLMMEYEVKFGTSLLNESILNPNQVIKETWDWIKEKTQILEQTYNPFNKDFYTSSNWKQAGQNIVTGATSTAKSIGNAILHPVDTIKGGIEWVKKNGIGGVMEKIRDGLYSGAGIAIQIFAQMTGVGNIAVGIVWGSMLIYDLYKVFSGGEWSWMDILFDVLGMISGGAVKALQIAMKSIGITKSMPMAAGIQKLAASPSTKGFMSTILSGISKVWGMIKSAGSWLFEKTGLKWIVGVLGKAEAFLSENLLKPIGNGLGLRSVGNKVVGKGGETLGSASRKSVAAATKTKGVTNPAIQTGFDYANKLADKIKGGSPSGSVALNTYGLSDDVLAALG
jgi:hypothetical protein